MPVLTSEITLDMSELDNDAFVAFVLNGEVLSLTATEIVVEAFDFSVGHLQRLVLTGTGFGLPDASGFPTTGTITGLAFGYSGFDPVVQLTGLNLLVADFVAALASSQPNALFDLLFAGADDITGGDEPGVGDVLEGYGGNDTIRGGDGADLIRGGAGADILYGGSETGITVNLSRDALDGGAGNDQIFGEGGRDVLLGGTGADLLDGGDGDDFLYDSGSGVTDVVSSTFVNMPGVYVGLADVRNVRINDTLAVDDDVDTLNGGAGNDGFNVGLGDIVDGGDGTDTATVILTHRATAVSLDLSGDQAAAVAGASGGAYTSVERFIIQGTDFNDIVLGSTGVDTFYGGLGADQLVGGDGNDALHGSRYAHNILMPDGSPGSDLDDGEADILSGGAGNDSIVAGAFDQIDGGDGTDTLSLSLISLTEGVSLDLTVGDRWATLAAASGGTIIGMENLTRLSLTQHNDTLRVTGSGNFYTNEGDDAFYGDNLVQFVGGGTGDDIIQTFGGNDRIWGGAGDDQIFGGDGADTIEADLDNNNGLALVAPGNDLLDGGAGNDILNGGGGDDRIIGGLGADFGDGGEGYDIADYSGATAGVSVLMRGYYDASPPFAYIREVVGQSGEAGGDRFLNMEQVTGSQFDDVLDATEAGYVVTLVGGAGDDTLSTANSLANLLDGGDGNDRLAGSGTLLGGAGDDVLSSSGSAQDIVDGGEGIDTGLFGRFRDDYSIAMDNGAIVVTGQGGEFRMLNVERLQFADLTISVATGGVYFAGTAGDDTHTGRDTDDELNGQAGSDQLDGAGGNDILRGGAGNDILTGGLGVDIADYGGAAAGVTVNLLAGVASNDGDGGSDTLTGIETVYGSAFNDSLTGDGGDNTFRGGAGVDVIVGGLGIDTVDYSAAAAGMRAQLNSNASTNDGDGGTDTFSGIENLTGSAFNDILIGDGNANVLRGGLGVDTLLGLDGNDVLWGGAGAANQLQGGLGNDTYVLEANDTIVESAGQGTDTVDARINTYTLATNVENLIFGGTGNFAGTGNALANVITGGAGADVLRGRGGADVLQGGGGIDTADYTLAAAGVVARLDSQRATNDGDGATDTFTSIENLIGSNFNDTLIGDANANILMGGNGRDILLGGGGDDILMGGGGGISNQLQGGAGDDRYILDAADTCYEVAGQGIDTVEARVGSYTLGNNVENLIYTGPGKFVGNGNALDNVITGGALDDILRGKGGNDTIHGGTGVDEVQFVGTKAQYTVSVEGSGYRIVDTVAGRDGSTYVESIERLRFINGNTSTILTYPPAPGAMEPTDKAFGEDFGGPMVSLLMDDPEVLPGLDGDGFLPLGKDHGAPQVLPVAETGPDGLPYLRDLAAGLLPAGERMALYLSDGLFGAGHPDPLDGGRGPDPWG